MRQAVQGTLWSGRRNWHVMERKEKKNWARQLDFQGVVCDGKRGGGVEHEEGGGEGNWTSHRI